MIFNEQYQQALDKKTNGNKLSATQQALADNQLRLLEKKHAVWDICFGLYCFTMAPLYAAMEDCFIDLKDKLTPNSGIEKKIRQLTPKRSNQNKKQYEKFLNGRIRKGIQDDLGNYLTRPFPYYCGEMNQAISGFRSDFFEKWMYRHINNKSGVIENSIDASLDSIKYHVSVLQTQVYNEMGRIPLDDLEIKSRAYTLYLLGMLLEELHMGWMLVGPVPEYVSLNREDRLDIYSRMEKLSQPGTKSQYYDSNWHHTMNDGFCYWNIRYAEAISRKVVGAWTHQVDGNVDKAMEAIRRQITYTRNIEKLSNNTILETEDYSRELHQLSQIDMFRTGEIPMTLLHFEAVRMMNDGKSNDDIYEWLRKESRINITEAKCVQIVSTVEILRGIEEGRINPEYFNRGMKEANAHRNDKDGGINYGELGLQAINDMGKAIAEGLRQQEEQEEQRRREQSERDKRNADPLLRLSEKYNVTAMREKKPKQPVTPKVEVPKVEAPEPQMEMTIEPPTPVRRSVRWTPDEENYLRKSWGKIPMDEMQKHLWRTEASIRCKASRLFSQQEKAETTQIPFTE